MSDYVMRFHKLLDLDHLQATLEGATWAAEPIPSRLDMDLVRAAVDGLDSSLAGSAIDAALVQPLHRALSELSRREAADMRLWHWMAVKAFPELVWLRWHGEVPAPEDVGNALTVSMSKRFLGKSSLNGVSRNTFARLWWVGEELHEGDNYELARFALSNQDMFQNVFERFFGIYPAAARACLRTFEPYSEAERRRAARWLQQCLSTTVLESLSEAEIGQIVEEALAA